MLIVLLYGKFFWHTRGKKTWNPVLLAFGKVGVNFGYGVFVGVGIGVLVGNGVAVLVGIGVSVGRDVGVSVGTGVLVGRRVGV